MSATDTPEQTHAERMAAHRRLLGEAEAPKAAPKREITLAEQAKAFEEELPHQLMRLDRLAKGSKLHPGFVAWRKREMQAALATLQRLALEAIPVVPPKT